ncbi:MAG: hypothetical protein M1326_07760 [Cyanobacteria bacterium]|nr:hypothetical protein [Cyanobacteriota bacterium]
MNQAYSNAFKASKVNKAININRKITTILLVLSFIGFVSNLTFYILMHLKMAVGLEVEAFIKNIEIFAGISMVLMFFFHISSVIAIIFEIRAYQCDSLLRSFIFFLSVISTIMLFGDWALIGDITKEYKAGLIEGIFSEYIILYFSQALHIIFYIFTIILLAVMGKKPQDKNATQEVLKDEAVFINVQYIGIFTSILGLAILVSMSLFTPLWAIKKGIITLCIVLVLPYAAIVVYWLILKIRERITEWYDEKQFEDVTKASFISFLVSIVILAVFFLIQNLVKGFDLMHVIWFPLYFFVALLVFSATILYLNKKTYV